ncbi:hypothetical protein NO2_0844 [Candidatus Termititenax persephonae]|uniref:Lipoprotein n=1 Tax=Candidatus Termititenax persephonae TaxID=2218525 RepID=A0A388TGN4_9BACT|nr:hypothetical protein NO2_0844 [Candidatus Termititenax persephonae]
MSNKKILIVTLGLLSALVLSGCGKLPSKGSGTSSYSPPEAPVAIEFDATNANAADLNGVLAGNEGNGQVRIKQGELLVSEDVQVAIPSNKTLLVGNGATLIVSANTELEIYGNLVIEPGAELYDDDRAGGEQWQKNDTAALIFQAGAKGYRWQGDNPYLFLGGAGDSPQVIQLNSGSLAMKKDTYELRGNAAVVGDFIVADNLNLTVVENATATVESPATLTIQSNANIALEGNIIVKSGATLKDVHQAGGTIWNSGNGSGALTFEYGGQGYLNNVLYVSKDSESSVVQIQNGGSFTLGKDYYDISGYIKVTSGTHAIGELRGTNGAKLELGSGASLTTTVGSITSFESNKTYVYSNGAWSQQG